MLAYLRRELYIIDNLRVKMLIKNNINGSKGIIINIVNKKARINSYCYECDDHIGLQHQVGLPSQSGLAPIGLGVPYRYFFLDR